MLWRRQPPFLTATAHRDTEEAWESVPEAGVDGLDETGRSAALRYSLERGGRSGRVARQFANEWIGRVRLGETPTPEGPGRPVGR